MKTLRDLAIGEEAVVIRLTGEGVLKRRIMDMGLTIEVTVRGYELSIRKDEAQNVIVE